MTTRSGYPGGDKPASSLGRPPEGPAVGKKGADLPRLAFRVGEAAAVLGVSDDFFAEHIAQDLRWVRRGAVKLVARAELERWLAQTAVFVWPEERAPRRRIPTCSLCGWQAPSMDAVGEHMLAAHGART